MKAILQGLLLILLFASGMLAPSPGLASQYRKTQAEALGYCEQEKSLQVSYILQQYPGAVLVGDYCQLRRFPLQVDGSIGDYSYCYSFSGGSACPTYTFYSDNPEDAQLHKNAGESCCSFGDPINPAIGNKYESKIEFRGEGLFPLEFVWTYNSNTAGLVATPQRYMLGNNRHHNYSASVQVITADGTTLAYLARSNGRTERYVKVGASWVADTDNSSRLLDLVDSQGASIGWERRDVKGIIERFNNAGRLVRIINPSGFEQVLIYDTSNRLQSVTDPNGRSLVFSYNGGNQLTQLSLPDGGAIVFTYSNINAAFSVLSSVQYPSGSTVNYTYSEPSYIENPNQAYALTGVFDETGLRYSSTSYDLQQRAFSTELANGVDRYSATYAWTNELTYTPTAVITYPLGQQESSTYTAIQGVTYRTSHSMSCTGCVTTSKSTTFDTNGRTDITTDNNGVTTDRDYNARGLLIQKIDAANASAGNRRTTQIDWHTSLDVPTERRTYNAANTLIAKSTYAYNTRGQALTASQIDPVTSFARTSTTTYCEDADVTAGTCPLVGLVTSVNGPRTDAADTVSYTYYPSDDSTCAASPTTCPHRKGDLWKVTNALGQITETLAYDGAGRVLSVKDANSVVTDLAYHPRGWLISRKTRGANNSVETDDAITQIEYWPTGLVKKVIQPEGAFTSYIYDAAHRLTDISDNTGNTIHYTLDNAGNRTQEDTKDPGNVLKRTLSRVYNQLGQLQTQADAQANPTDFAYDANGNTDTVTDALGRITDNDYDPLNRLSRTLQDVGGIAAQTQFAYDAQDNLTQVTDPKGLNTTYTYNGLGDLTQLVSPDTGTTSYTYDSAGNRISKLDANDPEPHTYLYDALNRLTSVFYSTTSGGTSPDVQYTYDAVNSECATDETFAKGRLTTARAEATLKYCYDRFGNLTRKVQSIGGKTFVLRYAYTKAGQLQSVTYPDGAVADYVRDAQGRVTEVGVTRAGGAREILLHQASYHPFGPVAGWTYGNGRQLLRPLNQNYQPTAIQDAGVGGLSVGFQYDPVGNLTQLTPAASATPLVKFDYDALSRLIAFKDGPTDVAIESYAYDATGNRQSFTNASGTQAYTYPSTSHRLSQVGTTVRSYDAAGNTISIGGTARVFGYSQADRLSSVKQGGVVTMQYGYNASGERVVSVQPGMPSNPDGSGGTPSASTYSVYDEAGHWLGNYDNAGAALQQAIWLDDLPVGLIANGNQLHYVEPDHLGTPRVVIEVARNVPVWTWDLKSEAFGNSVPTQDPDGDSNSLVFDMRFPGQRYDSATGANQNYFRDYDSFTGRYVQSDSLGLVGGINTYAYVGGNPIFYIDPKGEFGIPGAIYGAIAGGIGGYISSGSWQGALLGAGAGAVVGAINPFAASAAGGAAGGIAASLIGQTVGNAVAGKDITDYCNYDFVAAAGAGLGGALGGPLNSMVGRFVDPFRREVIGSVAGSQTLSYAPGNTLGAIAEGLVGGAGELAGTKLSGGPGGCGCQ